MRCTLFCYEARLRQQQILFFWFLLFWLFWIVIFCWFLAVVTIQVRLRRQLFIYSFIQQKKNIGNIIIVRIVLPSFNEPSGISDYYRFGGCHRPVKCKSYANSFMAQFKCNHNTHLIQWALVLWWWLTHLPPHTQLSLLRHWCWTPHILDDIRVRYGKRAVGQHTNAWPKLFRRYA